MERASASLLGAMILLLLIACTGTSRQAIPPTPTAGPVVLATAPPTATATRPAPTPIAPPTPQAPSPSPAGPATVYVTNTGGQGLTLRQTPGGTPMGGLPDGTALTATGEEQSEGDRVWRKVRDARGREGWVAADFLTEEGPGEPSPVAEAVASPSAEPARTTPTLVEPTWPVPLIPTATLRPPGSVPTRTPRVTESPAPIAPPTTAPIVVPGIVATKPAIAATKPAAGATKPALTGNCHTSYPDFCIPPPPPDLDCSSPVLAGRRRFAVRPPDPHQLDNNVNGIGCE